MTTVIIIIAIGIAILCLVAKVAISRAPNNSEPQSSNPSNREPSDAQRKKTSKEEIKAVKEAHIKRNQENENRAQEPKEVSFPPTEQGYFYYEMVGMYHRGIASSDFGIYEGRAVAETNNPHDKFAIGIYRSKDNKLFGYIPMDFRGESNEGLHRNILYNGGCAKAAFKVQGSAQRSYGTVYIKTEYKAFRSGNEKTPYKSKGVKEFHIKTFGENIGNYKCILKINSPIDEYDYTVSAFSESGDLIGQTDNNELKLFDYVEERESGTLSWCCIDADAKKGTLYVPLNLTEKTIHQKLDAFLGPAS